MKKIFLILLINVFIFADINVNGVDNLIVHLSCENVAKTDKRPFGLDSFFENTYNPKFYSTDLESFKKSLGSAIVIDKSGYILTTYSTIENADKIFVWFNSKKIPAKIIGADNEEDLAVIKIKEEEMSAFSYSKNVHFELGQDVFVFSKPFNDKLFLSKAFVSFVVSDKSPNGRYKYIILNGSINSLQNGAALLSQKGDLIGIVNAKFSRENGSKGFFVVTPIDIIRKVVTKILAKEDKEDVWFGASIGMLEKQDFKYYNREKGVIIISVEGNSPAQTAGLKKGDLIVSIDDVPIDNPQDLNYQIASMRPGDVKLVEYIRDLKTYEAVLTLKSPLGSIEKVNYSSSKNGLVVEPLTIQTRRLSGIDKDMSGVFVESVIAGTHAQKSGFKAGDIIIKIDDVLIKNSDDFKSMLSKKTQRVTIFRKGIIRNIEWKKDEQPNKEK